MVVTRCCANVTVSYSPRTTTMTFQLSLQTSLKTLSKSPSHITQQCRLIHLVYACTTKFALGNHQIKEFNNFKYPDPKNFKLEIWNQKPLKFHKTLDLQEVQEKMLKPGIMLLPLEEEDQARLPQSDLPRYYLNPINTKKVYKTTKNKSKGRGSKEFHFKTDVDNGHFKNCIYKAYHFLSRDHARSPVEIHIHLPTVKKNKKKKKTLEEPSMSDEGEKSVEEHTKPAVDCFHLWPSTITKSMPTKSWIIVGPLYSSTRICWAIDLGRESIQAKFEKNKQIQLDLDHQGKGTPDKATRRKIKQDLKKIREDLKSENQNLDVPIKRLMASIPGCNLKRPDNKEKYQGIHGNIKMPGPNSSWSWVPPEGMRGPESIERSKILCFSEADQKLRHLHKAMSDLQMLREKRRDIMSRWERERTVILERAKKMYTDDELCLSKRASLLKQCEDQWDKKKRLVDRLTEKKSSKLFKLRMQLSHIPEEYKTAYFEGLKLQPKKGILNTDQKSFSPIRYIMHDSPAKAAPVEDVELRDRLVRRVSPRSSLPQIGPSLSSTDPKDPNHPTEPNFTIRRPLVRFTNSLPIFGHRSLEGKSQVSRPENNNDNE